MTQISIATINIASASKERANRLFEEWLKPTSYDIYVFTETSDGDGTSLIISEFQNAGWTTFHRPATAKDRGVAIASRIGGSLSSNVPKNDPAPGRALVFDVNSEPPLEIVGMYVPNRGNDWAKTERKRSYLDCWLRYLSSPSVSARHRILIGDLNVVPQEQRPVFLPQQQFEYDWFANLVQSAGLYDAALKHGTQHEHTWVAHTGEGYTYDHIMPDKRLATRVAALQYDHTTRRQGGLTDHSAIILTVVLDTVERLGVRPLGQPIQTELF